MVIGRPFQIPAAWLAGLYVAAVLAPVAAALSGPEPLNWAAELGSAAGLAAGSVLAVQFVTSGRFELIGGSIGIDRIIGFHRFAGRALIVLLLAHIVGFVVAGGGDLVTVLERSVRLLTAPSLLTGVAAAVLIGFVVWTAVRRERLSWTYEAWRACHGICSTVAFVCVIDHVWARGTYIRVPTVAVVGAVLAVVAVFALLDIHFMRSARVLASRWRTETVRRLGPKLWEVVLRHQTGRRFRFRAGQFVWATFGRQPTVADHPFSIASAPAELPQLRFVIKEAGDFTNRIGKLAPGTIATLDGPHGNLVVWDDQASVIILIAGGVGIAPIIGILRSLASSHDRRPVRLVVATKTAEDQVFTSEVSEMRTQLDLAAAFIVEVPSAEWAGPIGKVNRDVLAVLLSGLDTKRALALLCGPRAMMGKHSVRAAEAAG